MHGLRRPGSTWLEAQLPGRAGLSTGESAVVNRKTLEGHPLQRQTRWNPVVLSNGKRELMLDPPWTNASGTLGFSTESASLIEFPSLGGFITNPISRSKRDPAAGHRFFPTTGGFVLHTGLPNPGLSTLVRRHRRRWRAMATPVILHLISQDARELAQMAEMLESIEEIAGVEVGVQDEDPSAIARLIGAAATCEIPILARLPFEAGVHQIRAAIDAGATAISFAPPRAAVPVPGGTFTRGRLYGPVVFPMALERIKRIRDAGIADPILAAGGVYRRSDLEAMLAAGASGVQLDSVLWTEPEAVLAQEDGR
jgi:dihydroorotate dehydrogenase